MNKKYETLGYDVARQCFSERQLREVKATVLQFHEQWKLEHAQHYATKAVNSAYITHKAKLPTAQRQILFNFIASDLLFKQVAPLFNGEFRFMNTQLFFNPVNEQQANYWHRDPQYHLSLTEQKNALTGPQVIHVRIPLFDEPGIELIPRSHIHWDTEEELAVRCETHGRKNHEALKTGVAIELKAGDVLFFCANMIHRGLYGKDRLALDILFCDSDPSLLSFIDPECLPTCEMLSSLDHPELFGGCLKGRFE